MSENCHHISGRLATHDANEGSFSVCPQNSCYSCKRCLFFLIIKETEIQYRYSEASIMLHNLTFSDLVHTILIFINAKIITR